jgi:peptide/nickel transport system ATP-binding protein
MAELLAIDGGTGALVATALRVMAGAAVLVEDVSLTVPAGEVVALVGASGSGKSVTARCLLGLFPARPGLVRGDIRITWPGGTISATEQGFSTVRGELVTLIPQDARGGLDPLWTVGRTVSTAAVLGGHPPAAGPWLARAGLDPAVATRYPHELSGGMAQRAAIAAAIARSARFLVADEPTTGLDPTVQREVLDELRRLADEGLGILFITHDLRILAGFADRVLVMDGGRVVEEAARVGELRGAGRALVEATRRIQGGR